ncbi:MAG: 3D domain-containing protein [Planctomycetota bacterium]
MAENAPEQFDVDSASTATNAALPTRRSALWVAAGTCGLALLALGAAGTEAMQFVFGTVDVEPAVHISSTDEDRAAYEDFLVANARPDAQTDVTGEVVLQTKLMEVTAYCACTICCGKNAVGITASGKPVSYNGGLFVAADVHVLPFGTKLRIPGYGEITPQSGDVVEVIDTGSAIVGDRLDVFFDDHQVAREWGRQWLPVQVVETFE